jgi:D-amino-acid dehydrogenase
MDVPKTVIVIGDGVVGLSVAIGLQRRGIATRIVAPDKPWEGASWGNAGHIATEQAEPLASIATIRSFPRRLFLRGGALSLPPRAIAAWLPFALRMMRASTPARFALGRKALSQALAAALPAWRTLLAEAGRPDLLRENGHFVVWESPASAEQGRQRWNDADTGTACFRDATAAELAQLRALTTAPVAGAIRFEGTGQIADMHALGAALKSHFSSLGGQFVQGRVTDIRSGARLEGGERLTADIIVVAAGAGSAALLSTLGIQAPLIAERGYHMSAGTDWPIGQAPVVFEDRSMIVTRFAHGLRAASFVEFAGPDTPPDPRKWVRLRDHARALGIRFEEPVRQWIGARPTLPDYLPALGRLREAPHIAYAFGHQHLGLTLGPATGEALAAALACEVPAIDLEPFDLKRFA